jgi:hypothetical protein
MGHVWERAVRTLGGSRSTPLRPVLAVFAAALMIHLFGPALQASAEGGSASHSHTAVDAATHSVGSEVAVPAEAHPDASCHSLVGVTSAATAVPTVPCSVTTWRPDASTANVGSGFRNSWIGGDGGDASADPRRSPGVQRT